MENPIYAVISFNISPQTEPADRMDAVLDQKIYGVILWDGACAVTVNISDNLNIGRTFVGFKVIDSRRTKLLTSRTVWTRAPAGRNVMYRLGCYKTPRTIKRACGHRLLL